MDYSEERFNIDVDKVITARGKNLTKKIQSLHFTPKKTKEVEIEQNDNLEQYYAYDIKQEKLPKEKKNIKIFNAPFDNFKAIIKQANKRIVASRLNLSSNLIALAQSENHIKIDDIKPIVFSTRRYIMGLKASIDEAIRRQNDDSKILNSNDRMLILNLLSQTMQELFDAENTIIMQYDLLSQKSYNSKSLEQITSEYYDSFFTFREKIDLFKDYMDEKIAKAKEIDSSITAKEVFMQVMEKDNDETLIDFICTIRRGNKILACAQEKLYSNLGKLIEDYKIIQHNRATLLLNKENLEEFLNDKFDKCVDNKFLTYCLVKKLNRVGDKLNDIESIATDLIEYQNELVESLVDLNENYGVESRELTRIISNAKEYKLSQNQRLSLMSAESSK